MSNEVVFILTLLVIIVIQTIFFLFQIQKLLNKLMSRDFHEYTTTLNVPNREHKNELIKVTFDDDDIKPPVDLGF